MAFRLTRGLPADGLRPRRVTSTLVVRLMCQVALLGGRFAADIRPGESWGTALVAVPAPGLQTARARRFAVAGITTTCVTGTPTAGSNRPRVAPPGNAVRAFASLLALVAGALGGGFTLSRQPTAPRRSPRRSSRSHCRQPDLGRHNEIRR